MSIQQLQKEIHTLLDKALTLSCELRDEVDEQDRPVAELDEADKAIYAIKAAKEQVEEIKVPKE